MGVSLSELCVCVSLSVLWVCHFLCCVGVSLSELCVCVSLSVLYGRVTFCVVWVCHFLCVLCRNGRWRSQWEAVFSPGGSGELKAVVNAQVTRH